MGYYVRVFCENSEPKILQNLLRMFYWIIFCEFRHRVPSSPIDYVQNWVTINPHEIDLDFLVK